MFYVKIKFKLQKEINRPAITSLSHVSLQNKIREKINYPTIVNRSTATSSSCNESSPKINQNVRTHDVESLSKQEEARSRRTPKKYRRYREEKSSVCRPEERWPTGHKAERGHKIVWTHLRDLQKGERRNAHSVS